MINQIKQHAETKMRKAVDSLAHELTKIRTGRAHTSLLDHVQVEYYGSLTPLNQVANINVADTRTLTVTPWEKNIVTAVEKAIINSDLGLNPVTLGTVIRIPLPPLTEERRKELVKVVRHEGEQSKITIRNIRRDANQQAKDAVKDKLIAEDDERKLHDLIQKSTDTHVKMIDDLLEEKEQELMAV
jgi:ribosome recycling factor